VPESSTVVVRSVKDTPVDEAIRQALAGCDWDQWLSRGATVIIKPNLCTAVPDKVLPCNTDVVVIQALCEALLTRTNRIAIGESGHLRQTPWQTFAASGYVEMAKKLGVELVNFSESPTTPMECDPVGKIQMPRRLLESDVYINVPVLKTHALTYFTGAFKNQWGCVPDCHDRLRHHRHINPMLTSIQKMLKPKLVVMDAIVGMAGRGPVNGIVRRADAILASRDSVAIDATAMRMVGLTPEKAKHVMIGAKAGLGRMAAADIKVDGPWERVLTTFEEPPRDYANRAMFFATQYPWFVKNVLGNDKLYYPIRNMVVALRKLGVVAR
jgi:uncharacterized protein (DUF362 family)